MNALPAEIIGRYELHGEIASGGMATVYFGRLHDPAGGSRVVAIKRLHARNAKDPYFVTAFMDEARMAARVRHPNVVSTHEVVSVDGELLLVMDYLAGETLARLATLSGEAGERVPIDIAVAILADVLRGLSATHAARDAEGKPIELVHRDISPQNILVGQEGTTRIMDFGVAKALGRSTSTDEQRVKGKASYMSPEHIMGEVDARTDLWAASVVAWELFAGRRLFQTHNDVSTMHDVLKRKIPSLAVERPDLPLVLVAAIERGLQRSVLDRWQNARDYELAMCEAVHPASTIDVARWVQRLAGDTLRARAQLAASIERESPFVPGSKEIVTVDRPLPKKRPVAVVLALLGVIAVALLGYTVARLLSSDGARSDGAPTPTAPAITSQSPPVDMNAPPPAPPSPTASSATDPVAASAARPAAKVPTPRAVRAPATSKPSLCQFVDPDGIVKFRPCK